MTDQAKISDLAAELTRINKMPEFMDCITTKNGIIWDERGEIGVLQPEVAIAALYGVAAEACAEEGITISKNACGYRLTHCAWGPLGYAATYHEALIAALKQVDMEKKQ